MSSPYPPVPYLPYDALRVKAKEFLQKYHPQGSIPVPIEAIIELQMGIDIIPTPGLQAALAYDGHTIVGFTSGNMKEIWIDQDIYSDQPNRYKFTLAHEAGHCFLHSALMSAKNYTSIDGWVDFVDGMSEKDHGWYEWQAYAFAGLVLVPSEPLERSFTKHLRAAVKVVQKGGLNPSDAREPILDLAHELIAKEFGVSVEVVQRRTGYDKLIDRYDAFFRDACLEN